MIETIEIEPGLTFDVLTGGTPGAPFVLLLHGSRNRFTCGVR